MSARPKVCAAIVAAGVTTGCLGSLCTRLAVDGEVILCVVSVSARSSGYAVNEGARVLRGEDLVRAGPAQGAVLPGTEEDPDV